MPPAALASHGSTERRRGPFFLYLVSFSYLINSATRFCNLFLFQQYRRSGGPRASPSPWARCKSTKII